MKKWRVLVSASVVIALLLFACLVPIPVSRIRGQALVLAQADPSATGKVYVSHEGILIKLNVRPGDRIERGEEIALFRDYELEAKIVKAEIESYDTAWTIKVLDDRLLEITDAEERIKLSQKKSELESKHAEADSALRSLRRMRDEEMVLLRPVPERSAWLLR